MREFLKSGRVGYVYDQKLYETPYIEVRNNDEFIQPVLERWEKLGFIDGLDYETRKEVAYNYEALAQYLIFSEGGEKFLEMPSFEEICFPIVRRVIDRLDHYTFNFWKFLEYCKELDFADMDSKLSKVDFMYHIDYQAELCWIVSEIIIEMFKDPQKDIHELREERLNNVLKRLGL
jgi:hypothetical protein